MVEIYEYVECLYRAADVCRRYLLETYNSAITGLAFHDTETSQEHKFLMFYCHLLVGVYQTT